MIILLGMREEKGMESGEGLVVDCEGIGEGGEVLKKYW